MFKFRIENFLYTPILLILMICSFSNLSAFSREMYSLKSDIKQAEEIIPQIEIHMKENFKNRDTFIELYGAFLNMVHLNIVGNFEYIKDDAGIMQRIEPLYNSEGFLVSMDELSSRLNSEEIPLLYIQLPIRGTYFQPADSLAYYGKENLKDDLKQLGIDVLDIPSQITVDSASPTIDEFFFHTDVHLPTRTELWISKQISEYFKTQYNLNFTNPDEIFSEDSYQWERYDFWGNLGRTAGRTFSGIDQFESFVPQFEVNMRLTIPEQNIVLEGDFFTVMTNHYSDPDNNRNLYWVTNYGHYPISHYYYDNLNNSEGMNLLVISDSMMMRANTFLALAVSHITILDPRTFDGTDYLVQCLDSQRYDAVIVCGSSSLYQSAFNSFSKQ